MRQLKRGMMIVLLPLLLAVFAAFTPIQELTGKVVGIHDGDTLTLLTPENEQIKVRLEGIDAPEMNQAFGYLAKRALSDLVFGKQARIEVSGQDRYGRALGQVHCAGQWVNLALVESGFAWHYKHYSNDERLAGAEKRARLAKLGLWNAPQPLPPWQWRTDKRRQKAF